MPVLDHSILTRSYSNERLETSHVRACMARYLNIAMREAWIMAGLQCIGVLLCGMHVLRYWNERLKPRVRPHGLRLLLRDHLLLRYRRMRGVVYLLLMLFLSATDRYRDKSLRRVWLVRVDDDRMVLAALLGKRSRDAVAAARVLG